MSLKTGPFRYLERGSGPPVLWLHGLFGGPENWTVTLARLADRFHGLALQLPVDYQPQRRPADLRSIGQLTEYVAHFLAQRGIERTIIGGNSLGGQVALDFCLRYPQRASQLVLTGSAGLFEYSLSRKIPRPSEQFIREQTSQIFYDPGYVTDALVQDIYRMLSDRNYVRFLIRVAKATRDYNVKSELGRLGLPTLIVWGRQDRITPPKVAHEFQTHIRGAQLVFIERCGHSPPIERPEEFSQVVRDFLCGKSACADA
ncbi:MAG TPA: alpha/beta fold hydrolase [Candidatus Fraserbacteria bacterium]|nr:alpha/beta fold hydrolase [Candidatus Fraserbacteria bacterium]